MEQLETLARLMLEKRDKYEKANERARRYAACKGAEMGMTVGEYQKWELRQPVRTMPEATMFEDDEDIAVFVDSNPAFALQNMDIDAVRRRCREGYCHRHEYIEMFYVLKGGCYNYIDGAEEYIPEGGICLYNLQSAHERVLRDDESMLVVLCVRGKAFDAQLLDMLRTMPAFWQFFARSTREDDAPARCVRLQDDPSGEVEMLLYQMLRAYLMEDVTSQTVMRCLFVCLMSELARKRSVQGCSPDVEADADEPAAPIDDILGTIQAQCSDISLQELAKTFHFSTAYISRLIKRHTGRSFQQTQSHYWLEKAKTLLYCTNLPVEEIASLMGCSARSNFERKFKALTALSPAQYRGRREAVRVSPAM